MPAASSEAISPTAHYTGFVWARNGLSHPQLATGRGRLLYESLRPLMSIGSALGGPRLESYLLARHLGIDAMLQTAIERDGVSQVIELACGLSPRGWRFAERYGASIDYIEADLPAMAKLKRQALERMGSLSDRHRVQSVDVLRKEGPESIAAIAESLDPQAGLAIVIEGLVGYLDIEALLEMWRRAAQSLSRFKVGIYLSDLQLAGQPSWAVRAFAQLLSAFVGGKVALHHFPDAQTAESALTTAGFAQAQVRPPMPLGLPERHRADRGASLATIALAGTDSGEHPPR